jgi:hypothetical protein
MDITTTPPVTPIFLGLSRERPSAGPSREAMMGGGGFDWESLVPLFVHPAKVAVIEALAWIGQPLSPTELVAIVGGRYKLGSLSYHVAYLAKLGVLAVTHERQVRGARETYYYFPRPS